CLHVLEFPSKEKRGLVSLPLTIYRLVTTPQTDGEFFFEWSSSLLGILSGPGRHGLASNHVAHGEFFFEWSSSLLGILSRLDRV
ncbi:MAG: hypothetical protein QF437_13525, partial [Planctomycetota bacterium]|nr:hypothetical protein [Planctomycetota bacterium]